MLCLHVKAPFAAFRTFTAGFYRPTAPFITPSAAYGLVLNVAGIESRHDDGESSWTLTKPGLPVVELALGAVSFPEVQSVYQQLHNYPVGSTGKDRAAECKGAKYNIQPVRREFLSGLDAYICLRSNDALEERVRSGLREGLSWRLLDGRQRYGVPFLGDNSFMIDVLKERESPGPAYWYVRADNDVMSVERRCRLTVLVHREDMTRTLAYLYAPLKERESTVPEKAWTRIEPPVETPAIKKKTGRK